MSYDLSRLRSVTIAARLSDYDNCVDISSSGLSDIEIDIRHFLGRVPLYAVPEMIEELQKCLDKKQGRKPDGGAG